MSIHSLFSPSQLTRIIKCPGSVSATREAVKETTTYAEEGTKLHAVVEWCLDMNEMKVSQETIEKYKLEPEHIEAIQDVLDWVIALRMKYAGQGSFEIIEHRVTLAPYSVKTKCDYLSEVHGTLDFSFAAPSSGELYIVDWKFGKGVEVFPDTAQLKAYALGHLATLKDWKSYTKIYERDKTK